METKKGTIWKVALNYGLITGALLIIFSLIMYLLEIERESYINLLIYAFLLGGIIWGSKTYRDLYHNGFSTYGMAFGSAFLVGLIASILHTIMIFLLYKLDPSLIDDILLKSEEAIYENNQLSTAEMDAAIEWTKKFNTPTIIAVFSLIWTTVINLVMSLIVAVFIKKENPV